MRIIENISLQKRSPLFGPPDVQKPAGFSTSHSEVVTTFLRVLSLPMNVLWVTQCLTPLTNIEGFLLFLYVFVFDGTWFSCAKTIKTICFSILFDDCMLRIHDHGVTHFYIVCFEICPSSGSILALSNFGL